MASITKRGKTWAYRVYYYENGERKYVSQSGFRTKAEAKDASVLKENELLVGKKFEKEQVLLADYMETWKKLYKEDTVSLKSVSRINTIIKYVRNNYNLPLKKITHENYQEFLNKVAETRSKETVKKYHTYVKATIKYAIKTKVLLHDPTTTAVLKGMNDNCKPVENKFLNAHEVEALEKELYNGLHHTFTSRYIILFSLYTGARFGECLGMTWDCVDFEKSTIKIEKGFDYHFTNDFTDGKTRNSHRIIKVPNKLIKLLSTLPIPKNQTDRIFPRISNNAVNKTLRLALARAGIERDVTFHALRHTHASMLLAQGVQLLSVSKRLGHADPNITLQTYAHVLSELEEEDDKKLNYVFS